MVELLATPMFAIAPPDISMTVGLLVALAVAGTALALARRLPAGVPLASLVTAVSAALLFVAGGAQQPVKLRDIGIACTALALAWLAIGWTLAARVPGALRLLAGPPHGVPVLISSGATCAALAWAALVCAGATGGGAANRAASSFALAPAVMQGGFALAALLWVLGHALRERVHRRVVWLSEPRRLLERPTVPPMGDHAAALLAISTGIVAMFWPTPGVSGVSLVFAAMACGGLYHRRAAAYAGDAALLLIGETVMLSAVEWLGESSGLLLGPAFCGLLFIALGTFWRLQLDEGRPWTTAGRLVPATRRAAAASGLLLLAVAIPHACGWTAPHGDAGSHAALIAVLAVGAAWLALHLHDSDVTAQFSAMALTCGAGLVGWSTLCGAASQLNFLVAPAAAGSLLALLIALPLGRRGPGILLAGFIWGALPILTIWLVSERGLDRAAQSMIVLTLAAGATAAMARFAADHAGQVLPADPPGAAKRGAAEVG